MALIVATLLMTGSARGSASGDTPTIVPWRAIGGISLGMARSRVFYDYGYGPPREFVNTGSGTVIANVDSV